MVRCYICDTVIAQGAAVTAPLSVMDGLLRAGFLLGACVDVVARQECHQEKCPDAAFAYDAQEISRGEARGIAPWLGVR